MHEQDQPHRRAPRIGRDDAADEVDDELAFHFERRVAEYVERGMDEASAKAAARERLGDLRSVRRECAELLAAERRAETRRTWVRFSWLDVKLGVRLLRKYPGLTLVGGLAMAFAIAVGAGAFEMVKQYVDPVLPLPNGERIVALQLRDAGTGAVEPRVWHDFVRWQAEVRTVQSLGAWRTVERNLILRAGEAWPVAVAEITASASGVTGVSPQLGRWLEASDERPGAPLVVVLGHDLWQTRFGGEADIVGRMVHLDGVAATVVGVMPEGFAFPVSHRLWTPLRVRAPDHATGEGPALSVFGLLAEGRSPTVAQTELSAIGARTAAERPETHRNLRAEVVPFAASVATLDVPPELRPLVYAVNLVFVMLMVLVCANIALLMFARAASRESEIVVRAALGASRGRIVTQLFTEALVLGGVAAVVGLFVARFALAAWMRVSVIEWEGRLPFWFDDSLAPTTVLYALLLMMLGAGIAGVIPALGMTGRGVASRLRRLAAGGGGPRFGGIWTFVIVAQVAVAVTFPATAFFAHRHVVQTRSADVGFPTSEYLTARVEMTDAGGSQMVERMAELERRMEAKPGVLGFTFADRLPRMHHPARRIEIDDGAAGGETVAVDARVSTAAVALDWFMTLGAPILAGRDFHAADANSDVPAVIVNRSFVDAVLNGGSAVGRRIRYAAPPGEEPGLWHEIVGVVGDMGMLDDVSGGVGLYHPTPGEPGGPLHLALHVRGEPQEFAPSLRSAAAAVDPSLRLHQVVSLDDASATMWLETAFLFRLLVGISAVALLLSLAGIYAVTAFTVTRRTREIGIRVALGASAHRVVAPIFARPLGQVAAGVCAGGLMTAALAAGSLRGSLGPAGFALVAAYALAMMAVCLVACVVPTRRALRVEPIEALRTEA